MPLQRITFSERERIELYLRMRKKPVWIVRRLGRDYSIIKREVARNPGEYLSYTALPVQRVTDRKAKKTNKRKLEKVENVRLKEYVESSLIEGYSPEQIPNRISIHERPKEIGERSRYGDWETGSVIFSGQQSVLSVQVERKTRLCRLKKVQNKTATEHEHSIREHLSVLPPLLRRSITRDNGTENVLHKETENLLNIASYFCDPYASWQKGGVENLV